MTAVSEAFWARVSMGDGCWDWTGEKTDKGYGVLRMRAYGKFRAHRLSWALAYGSVPADLVVCHRCDNRACVRPDHLFVGTQAENLADMAHKGRRKGERQCLHKLSEADVLEIRQRRSAGETQRQLAEAFGVARETVRSLLNGRSWRHI